MMMDEPSLGLAPLVVREIFRIIEEVNKKGVTILLIEQNAKHGAQDCAHRLCAGNGAHHHVWLWQRTADQRIHQGCLPRHLS